MYYESPEINDERQYADFCLDRNGKSILYQGTEIQDLLGTNLVSTLTSVIAND